ncbi:MAG: transposase family protein [bacterium]|nr:transposase family protein [bacterium]
MRWSGAVCPDCQQVNTKIHSRYKRHPRDLPCFGFPVQLHLVVRRFFCHHEPCSRRTFAESFPELVRFKKRRTNIDLLDSREVTDVTAWLQQHPGIEIVAENRGQDYAKAASLGAPEQQQVADRWHLLKNLREVVETVLGQKPAVLAADGKVEETDVSQQPTQTSSIEEEMLTTAVCPQ